MLDFRIHSFLAVCKYLSYTRAAQELNLTQPAITQHIQHLQKQYQVKFFTRENNQLSLTPEGRLFRNTMLAVNQAEKKLQDELLNLSVERHMIRFGASRIIAEYELPKRLAAYLKAHGGRNIQLTVEDTSVLLRQLDEGSLHFAIVDDSFPKTEYKYLPWSMEKCIWVCSSSAAIPEGRVRLEDLLCQNLILYTGNSEIHHLLLNLFENNRISLTDFGRITEINNLSVIKELVAEDCGIALLSQKAVAPELAGGLLKEIPVAGCEICHEFNFIWSRNSMEESLYRLMYEKLHDLDFLH